MGNYTQIEKEFGNRIQHKLNFVLQKQLPPNQIQNELNQLLQTELALFRFEKMQNVCKITNRNLICYVSSWLQGSIANPEFSITDNDMNGLMNAVSELDRKKGLDLILHTPGGIVTATESIVTYLRKMFNNDIRVIVPHMAMSAGTMIACSSREIILGKESSLGPIDPQYHNVPAQGVLKEFERAIKETQSSPNRSLIWKEIVSQYRPTFVGECENIVNLSYDLVKGWLVTCMLKNHADRQKRAENILNELASHDVSKVHDRHYDYIKCKKLGLKVTPLEKNNILQDSVLSLYHAYLMSIYRLPTVIKFIENQNGQSFVINGQRG